MKEMDEKYMTRALQLARYGAGFVSPNPMVGAVIVADGRIIGEGWHRRYGGPHAEVNAVRAVKPEDRHLIPESTIYVTLEPCSHTGKTPPCAAMLVREKFKRAVIATGDPNPRVNGRGIGMLRDAGIEVVTGVLEQEARELNRRFFTAFTKRRPYVQLKWAETADGFLAATDENGNPAPVVISNPMSKVAMHRERSMADAILVGTGTANIDNPALSLRLWCGRQPIPVTLDMHGHLREDTAIAANSEAIIIREPMDVEALLHKLYEEHGINSLMVEGGPHLLASFLESGIYDEIRREIAPTAAGQGIGIPGFCKLMQRKPDRCDLLRGHKILWYFC